jgi:hypothetical protein
MYRLIPVILVMAAAFLVPAPADAGEVEHDVITEAVTATLESKDWEAGAVDLLDIFMDTEQGSYCETYAAANYFIFFTFNLAEQNGHTESYDPSTGAFVSVSGEVIDMLDAMGSRCLDES